jgi:hypothetical protein
MNNNKNNLNNSENLKDGSSNMKQPKRCSYTILKNMPKDKCEAMAKAWAKQSPIKDKNVFRMIVKIRWRDKAQRRKA